MCVTLSGSLNSPIAPWLIEAPLAALCKKNGDYRPTAVGEVLRHSASHICCVAAKSCLPDLFLPYGEVGVGIRGGGGGKLLYTFYKLSLKKMVIMKTYVV